MDPVKKPNTNYSLPELTAQWVTQVLRDNGFLPQGHVQHLKHEKRPVPGIPGDYTFLEVQYSKDAPSSLPNRLFLKRNKPDSQVSENLRELIETVIHAEIYFYTELAHQMPSDVGIPCYGAACSTEDPLQFYILMEDISATHYQTPYPFPPTVQECEWIMGSFAKVHATFWEAQETLKPLNKKSPPDVFGESRQYVETNLPGFIDFLGDRISPQRREILEKTLFQLPTLDRLQNGPLTLVHGDSHFWNIFLPKTGTLRTARIFDWQGCHLSFGMVNIAEMLGLYLFSEMRQRIQERLLRVYHDTLVNQGVPHYPWSDCWQDYRLASLTRLWGPIYNWKEGMPIYLWWNRLESAFTLFEDLDCLELVAS